GERGSVGVGAEHVVPVGREGDRADGDAGASAGPPAPGSGWGCPYSAGAFQRLVDDPGEPDERLARVGLDAPVRGRPQLVALARRGGLDRAAAGVVDGGAQRRGADVDCQHARLVDGSSTGTGCRARGVIRAAHLAATPSTQPASYPHWSLY